MKQKKVLLILILVLLPLCLYAAGLKEAYNCGQAAEMLQITADAYHDPAPTVEDILAGVSPYMPLTRMEGCKMLLRAFGPLPDVQEGIRYLVKYRDCAFADVPEEGREAVENLTNAGLYIPEDNTKFGPNELMTESELAVLVDRIHAYLQSSLKDDFYSWANAELLNDFDFFAHDYTFVNNAGNLSNPVVEQEWILDMLDECLKNPDTPEKANIAAYISTYIDIDEHENSLTYIKPMVDEIWNASDIYELLDVLADISRETGFELLLTRHPWSEWYSSDFTIDDQFDICLYYTTGEHSTSDPDDIVPGTYVYDAYMERASKIFSLLGFVVEEIRPALENYLEGVRQTILAYNSSTLPVESVFFTADSMPEQLSIFPLSRYLERAGYGKGKICFGNLAYAVEHFSILLRPEYLSGIKADSIYFLMEQLNGIVPLKLKDAVMGFWDDLVSIYPGLIMDSDQLLRLVLPAIQTDVGLYYSTTEEYKHLRERLEILCDNIKVYYRQMLENTTWLSEETRLRAVEKLDALSVRLLVPSDYSNVLHVDYVSAEDGGTLMENVSRFMKARREYICRGQSYTDPSVSWSVLNLWYTSAFYSYFLNFYTLPLSSFIGNAAMIDTSYEALLAYIGSTIAHEISHGFDYNGSLFNSRGEIEDWWTTEDREEFTSRVIRLAYYLSGYEYLPGLAEEDGFVIVDESIADLTSLKCMMNIASKVPGFDYDHFFRCYADYWAVSGSRLAFELLISGDEHPIGRARVNLILSLIDEFYTTYDIKEGDAMYVAPEDRPYVW